MSPSDLNIPQLVERAAALGPEGEVILALSGDVEGETTSFYIYRKIAGLAAKISTLAPTSATSQLCDLEQVTSLPCAPGT